LAVTGRLILFGFVPIRKGGTSWTSFHLKDRDIVDGNGRIGQAIRGENALWPVLF
jgi:hypothetical protein